METNQSEIATRRFETIELSSRLLSALPKMNPKIAVLMARFDPTATAGLIARLRPGNYTRGFGTMSTVCARYI